MDDFRVYEPLQQKRIGFFRIWIIMGNNIISSRELIFQLFKRDFLSAYKKSFLGLTWVLVSPLFGIISWVFMNKTGLLNPGDVKISYTAYLLLGTSFWSLFMGFYGAALGTLNAGASFILQVKYPHEALLVKEVAQHLANFLLSFLITMIVVFILGVTPSWKIVLLPLMALPLFFLAAGIGLIMSVVGVVAPDIQRVFGVVMGLGIFAIPVIYSAQIENEYLQLIIKYNPLSYLIVGMRDVLITGVLPSPKAYAIASVISLFIFIFAWRFFFVSENLVIEKMI